VTEQTPAALDERRSSARPAGGPDGGPDGHPEGRRVAARVENLTKTYGSGQAEVHALDGVTLSLYAGEFTAVMGPSGSGKSTLMHCCAALDSATSGTVRVGETDLSRLKDKELTRLRRDQVGFVFQSFNLVPTLTAEENILLPLSIAGRKPDQEWYRTVIETVGLGDRLDHRPNQLSGGQQQRVAVARALASRPGIVFADEPTGNLDSRSGAEVLSLLRRSVDEFGQTIVMVTHDPVAAAYTDRVVFLADGRVVDELRSPDRDTVLERMTHMDAEQLDRVEAARAAAATGPAGQERG
jgi:putative ABC transport system ATP-binding protein